MRNTNKLILVLGALIALSPFSIDMYLPAFSGIASSLHSSVKEVGYSLTSYYAGLCVGQLVYGVLIDRFGRKKPLHIGLTLYLLASLACAFAGNLQLLILLRLLMALGGCVGMVAARAVVGDVFQEKDRAKVLSSLVLVMGVAPVIAPTIGGFVNDALGWRWVFGTMTLIAVVLILAVKFFLPETKKPDPGVALHPFSILRSYAEVIRNRAFTIYALTAGLAYAGMYAYIAGSPGVFMERFGLTSTAYGWAFAFNAIGLIAGSQLNKWALGKYAPVSICTVATVMLVLTSVSMNLQNQYLGLNASFTIGYTFLFLFWIGFINPTATALALGEIEVGAGRASAILGSIQMIAGVAASWAVNFFDGGSHNTMSGVMLCCALLSLISLITGLGKGARSFLRS